MTDRGHLREMRKADFADALDSASEDSSKDDEAEINQLREEHDLSDPKRTKITPLPFSTAERLEIFDMMDTMEIIIEKLQIRCKGQLSWLEKRPQNALESSYTP